MDKLVWIDGFNFQGICSEDKDISSWNINNFLPQKHSSALADFIKDLLLSDGDDLIAHFKGIAGKFFRLADEARFVPSLRENPLRNPLDEMKSNFLPMVNTFFFAVENLGDAKT
jgi:hypothetical protein